MSESTLAEVVRDWQDRLQQMAADLDDLIDGEMARELLAALAASPSQGAS
jgi:hypothetical protein